MRIYQNLSRLPPVLFSLKNAGQVLPEYQVTQYYHFIIIKTTFIYVVYKLKKVVALQMFLFRINNPSKIKIKPINLKDMLKNM
jgi:RAB protein geranylgeranyltransferase component A